MPLMQSPLASITHSNLLTYSHVGGALEKAGWQLCRGNAPGDGRSLLAIVDRGAEHAVDPLHHIVGAVATGRDTDSSVDFFFDPQDGLDALAHLFQSWLPPGTDPLDRLLAMFGGAEFLPLVKGLQKELVAACDSDRLGCVSPHRLAGLSGTLGFAALSKSWSALDAGDGDFATARRESRKAAVAIAHWLDGAGMTSLAPAISG